MQKVTGCSEAAPGPGGEADVTVQVSVIACIGCKIEAVWRALGFGSKVILVVAAVRVILVETSLHLRDMRPDVLCLEHGIEFITLARSRCRERL